MNLNILILQNIISYQSEAKRVKVYIQIEQNTHYNLATTNKVSTNNVRQQAKTSTFNYEHLCLSNAIIFAISELLYRWIITIFS